MAQKMAPLSYGIKTQKFLSCSCHAKKKEQERNFCAPCFSLSFGFRALFLTIYMARSAEIFYYPAQDFSCALQSTHNAAGTLFPIDSDIVWL